ncbi:hypothetical protein Clacol_002750 [Clathrus columnatus]|uniref:Mitochondrial PGP phosphatase n=1 Tax=Clathrus columnatus TaxID=1419009 RepID=A0AAV5A4Z1_9AGAM|nr:hypothetical protein Clacol_002750 [Clathrus columnatus]
MPFNISGILAAFQSVIHPRLLIPNMIVKDIRCLDFRAFSQAGFKRVVIDKDNCLTLPHDDSIIPELKVSWDELKLEFDPSNILIVSNSAGSSQDAAGLAAESINCNLGVPVLRHTGMKPSHEIVHHIRHYFACTSHPIIDSKYLLVIGDRVFTDVVLANRLGAFSVLVSRDWTRTIKGRFIYIAEQAAVKMARKRLSQPQEPVSQFLKTTKINPSKVVLNYSGSTWTWVGRALGWGHNTGKSPKN